MLVRGRGASSGSSMIDMLLIETTGSRSSWCFRGDDVYLVGMGSGGIGKEVKICVGQRIAF